MQPDTSKEAKSKSTTPSLRDDYVNRMDAQAKEWDAQLALWGAKADKTGAAVKSEFHKWQREFSDQRAIAQNKLSTLRSANHDAWEEMKAGMDSAWTDVKTAFETAKKKFD